MFTTTNNTAASVGNAVAAVQAMTRAAPPAKFDVLVKVGSVDLFVSKLDAEVGRSTAAKDGFSDISSLSLRGVPVVEDDILPPNMAVVFVNGEVVQIIRFE